MSYLFVDLNARILFSSEIYNNYITNFYIDMSKINMHLFNEKMTFNLIYILF